MKKALILSVFILFSLQASAQWGVSFHQSNLPFVGVERAIGERWAPELRVGADNFVENVSLELVGKYLLQQDQDKQIYLGFGARVNSFGGVLLPAGINYFPFAKKEFGFHMEAAPILVLDGGDGNLIFRASFGVRYRFLKD